MIRRSLFCKGGLLLQRFWTANASYSFIGTRDLSHTQGAVLDMGFLLPDVMVDWLQTAYSQECQRGVLRGPWADLLKVWGIGCPTEISSGPVFCQPWDSIHPFNGSHLHSEANVRSMSELGDGSPSRSVTFDASVSSVCSDAGADKLPNWIATRTASWLE